MLRFHALGPLAVSNGGADTSVGGPRQRRLLAMLLIHRNAVVSVDRLADAVFAGEPTPAASTTLRSYVARIRRVVDGDGSATVVTQSPGYMLQVAVEAFDAACFEQLVADAGSRLERGDPSGASAALRQAFALWRGDAYAEFAEEDWARPEAQRLEELRLVAHERLVDAELANGRAVEMIPQIEALTRAHELREGFRRQLMIALYRAGRHADALRVYRDYRRVLGEELGLEPSPALVELERAILTHDPELLLTQPSGRPVRGYRLGERLGTGRDGTVFAAHLPGVQREFAIRVIREDLADSPEFVRSFEARAHLVASLRHPAIVPIHDYWREPGAAYVVMRRMHGGTLTDRLAAGPLPDPALAALVRRIGGALEAAADLGIAHGRVTPDSVLFDRIGDAHLGDFALAPDQSCTADDVRDLALLVRGCLTAERSPVADVLRRGMTTVGRPPMAEFVRELLAALTEIHTGVGATPPNPYKGLRAFEEADAADFFGRTDVVEALLARLRGDGLPGRLVLLVGGSGTGKSSVVRAGLLPRIRGGELPGSREWFVTTMLPGSAPFKELAEALRRVAVTETSGLAELLAEDAASLDRVARRLVPGDGQLVLVIDQFEELFTMASERDRRAFLDGLLHAVSASDSRVRVVATLRADFYDRPLAVHGFGAVVSDATVTIPAMSPAQLESAVVEPAERVGRQVERALVAELVSAVVDQPAALPSLQFTLFELAERTTEPRLRLADHRAMGGVEGAIASRAEQMYLGLDDDERVAVRRMFEQLVVVSADGEPTRRRVTRTELTHEHTDPILDASIDHWTQARLLTADRHPQSRMPTVEIAHEALLGAWPRLRGWIEEDREALMLLGHLREAAASWDGLDRDQGALYRGARLDAALEVVQAHPHDAAALEREFLETSLLERDRERQEAADRVARQARSNRRLRIQLAAIGVALVAALGGGLLALDQRGQARQERRLATARELAASADASLADDPERSVLLALAAVDASRSDDGPALPEAETALHRAVAASRILLSVPDVGGTVDWSPDGSIFVTEGQENSGLIDIRDASTGASVRSFSGHDIDINDVAFSSDGSLATVGDDGALRVWDPATGEQRFEYVIDEPEPVFGPSFSPDGTLVAASFGDGFTRVFDLASGALVGEFDSELPDTAFSADGTRLALSAPWFGRPHGIVIDLATGEEAFRLPGTNDQGTADVEWSPDGRWIATAGLDGVVRIWEAETGALRFTMTGHTAGVGGVDWSPDSTRLATAGFDGTAIISEITDDGVFEQLTFSARDTSGGVAAVAFSPDGRRLMTGDTGIVAVKIWDATPTGGGELANVDGAEFGGLPSGVADFTPAPGRLVVGHDDGSVTISDPVTGDRLRVIEPRGGDGEVVWVAASGDGELVAAAASGGAVNVWDVASGDHRFEVPVGDAEVWALEWSPDGEWLAMALNDFARGRAVIVDRSGAVISELREAPGQSVETLSFSPDGRRLATTRVGYERSDPENMEVTIWDWQRGEAVATIATPAERVVFDPTGATLATNGLVDGLVQVWDVETGARVATLAPPSAVGALAYGPDGTTLATGHADGTVRLWDPHTGRERLVLPADDGRIVHVAFSSAGSRLASVGVDGLVRVWTLELDELITIAETRLTRSLSDEECRQYLHVESCLAA